MIARGRSAAFLLLSVLYLTLYAPPASASDGDGTVQPLVVQFTTGPAWLAGKPFQDRSVFAYARALT